MDFYQFLAQLLPPPNQPYKSPVITHTRGVNYQAPNQFLSSDRQIKKCGRKSTYSEEQIAILENCFNSSGGYINRDTRRKLAVQLNISPQRVLTWFQSRRTKLKKENGLMSKNTEQSRPFQKNASHSQPMYYYSQDFQVPKPCQSLKCTKCPKVFKKYMYLENHFSLYHSCSEFKYQM